MLSPSEIRVGVAYLADSAMGVCDETSVMRTISLCGLAEQNITFKYIPGNDHVALGVLFFAEYTEVDCVFVVGNGRLDDVIRKSLCELQIQWNMPVATASSREDLVDAVQGLVEMVRLQSDMAADVPAERMTMGAPRKDMAN